MSSLPATTSPRCLAQQRLGPQWYSGSANAIHQSLNLIHDEKPDLVIVFADHVYRMDPRHRPAPRQRCRRHGRRHPCATTRSCAFGVIKTAADGRQVEAFWRSRLICPACPTPDESFVSMGNYVFSTEALIDALHADAADEFSKHDMGGDIMPMMVEQGLAQVYDFQSNQVPGARAGNNGYRRDVGTLDSYYDAHMDLCAVVISLSRLVQQRLAGSSRTYRRTRRRSSSTKTVTESDAPSTA